jgi:hypothetical protein
MSAEEEEVSNSFTSSESERRSEEGVSDGDNENRDSSDSTGEEEERGENSRSFEGTNSPQSSGLLKEMSTAFNELAPEQQRIIWLILVSTVGVAVPSFLVYIVLSQNGVVRYFLKEMTLDLESTLQTHH